MRLWRRRPWPGIVAAGPGRKFTGPGAAPRRRPRPSLEPAGPLEIHHVVGSLTDIGGPSYTVPRLAQAMGDGHEIVIHTLSAPAEPPSGYGVRAYAPRGPLRRFGGSPEFRASLEREGRTADVIHSHGIWLRTDLYAARAGRRTGTPTVVTTRGMLDPWAMRYHRGRKRLVWHTGQRAALARAACLHATAPSERGFIRDLGFTTPVAEIPNGVDVPADPSVLEGDRRTLLFLARVHPKKGVLNLIEAWSQVERQFPEWDLVIAGPDDGGHLAEVVDRARHAPRVEVLGEVSDEEKDRLHRRAELYVLPTFNENWGVTVADALSYGVPAVVGRGAPWQGLHEHRCGWWIDNDPDTLAATLGQALALTPDALREMGMRGRAWVGSAFGWDRIGEQMGEVYAWIVDGGPPPPCVHLHPDDRR